MIVADKNERILSDYDLVLNALNSDIIKVGNTIKDFINENSDSHQIFRLLIQAKREHKEKTMASSRDDDQNWFHSTLDRNCLTKEEVMKRKSQDRIKGYFYKVKDEILHSDIYKTSPQGRALLNETLDYFKYLLVAADYFSCIFDRSHPNRHSLIENFSDEIDAVKIISKRRKLDIINFVAKDKYIELTHLKKSLCTSRGDFYCGGRWSDNTCQYNQMHIINPYSSRENLILFQTWNLDHQIEFTRAIIPSLLENVSNVVSNKAICRRHKMQACQISIFTYFKEFFTIDNLKLVHIICHDKGCHDLKSKGTVICQKCDEFKFIQRFKDVVDNFN